MGEGEGDWGIERGRRGEGGEKKKEMKREEKKEREEGREEGRIVGFARFEGF